MKKGTMKKRFKRTELEKGEHHAHPMLLSRNLKKRIEGK